MLAHPERNPDVQEDPGRLERVVELGAVPQLTAAAVDGRMGKRQSRCAFELLERGLALLIASDAHAPGVREAGLSAARRAVGDEAFGRWLTEDVPAALLAGEELPERPAVPRGGGCSDARRGLGARPARRTRVESAEIAGLSGTPSDPVW